MYMARRNDTSRVVVLLIVFQDDDWCLWHIYMSSSVQCHMYNNCVLIIYITWFITGDQRYWNIFIIKLIFYIRMMTSNADFIMYRLIMTKEMYIQKLLVYSLRGFWIVNSEKRFISLRMNPLPTILYSKQCLSSRYLKVQCN